MKEVSRFSKNERIAVYSKAYEYYLTVTKTSGMCQVINRAIFVLCRSDEFIYLNKTNFPEYFSYKPKNTWRRNSRWWWAPTAYNYDRRLGILERLSKGLSKDQ